MLEIFSFQTFLTKHSKMTKCNHIWDLVRIVMTCEGSDEDTHFRVFCKKCLKTKLIIA